MEGLIDLPGGQFCYNPHEEISRGANGTVYVGYKLENGRPVYDEPVQAVKKLSQGAAAQYKKWKQEKPGQSAMQRADELTKSLKNNDHVVRVHIDDCSKDVYIISERFTNDLHVYGKACRQSITENGIPPNRLITIAKSILSAVADAHKLKILHRDLKLKNVLVNYNTKTLEIEKVAVTDWGECRKGQEGKNMTEGRGTPSISAPEIYITGVDNYTNCVDIWSFGALFYELVSGEELVTQDEWNAMELLLKSPTEGVKFEAQREGMKRRFEFNREAELRVDLLPGWVDVFFRDMLKDVLRYDPKQRPTADELHKQVEAFQNGQIHKYKPKNEQTLDTKSEAQRQVYESLLAEFKNTANLRGLPTAILPSVHAAMLEKMHITALMTLVYEFEESAPNFQELLRRSQDLEEEIKKLNPAEKLKDFFDVCNDEYAFYEGDYSRFLKTSAPYYARILREDKLIEHEEKKVCVNGQIQQVKIPVWKEGSQRLLKYIYFVLYLPRLITEEGLVNSHRRFECENQRIERAAAKDLALLATKVFPNCEEK